MSQDDDGAAFARGCGFALAITALFIVIGVGIWLALR
jgi:hypothetical protein